MDQLTYLFCHHFLFLFSALIEKCSTLFSTLFIWLFVISLLVFTASELKFDSTILFLVYLNSILTCQFPFQSQNLKCHLFHQFHSYFRKYILPSIKNTKKAGLNLFSVLCSQLSLKQACFFLCLIGLASLLLHVTEYFS